MASRFGTCGCGAWWQQRGNATGHCAGCHRTFSSLRAFDAHQVGDHNKCTNPADRTRRSGEPLFVRQDWGACASQEVWALKRTPQEMESLARLKGQ